ncbi:reverse transcriptase [Caerostris extrusa]|uniref:Reverse transcriptase n=1 Tax=Caerostris extrusa TaxID=172846 RepID=A0AAV4Q4B0_CAEEX|nr:reverse transcriptase [Caerostris extrusa]
MWDLERIGITDEVQTVSKAVENQLVQEQFLKGLSRYEDGRYCEFRYKRVVFGVTSSLYLLAAVISFHVENVHAKFEVVAEKLLHAFNVDNCVTSVDTNVELEVFIQQATAIMADAKMELRLQWDRIQDNLFIPFKSEPIADLSKRKLLPIVHSVFDPLGFVMPVMVPAKLILQEAWATEANWDLPLPDELQSRFSAWYHGLSCISQLKFERRIGYGKETPGHHKFSVMPKVTIPRLELLACVLGSRLAKYVAVSLREVPTYYWTDATVALCWIQREENWGVFEKENSVHGLQVVRGDYDVLRVKTRIIERDDDLSFLYPILLPSKHYLTECLIREYHLKYCHAGVQILAAKLRLQYWIFSSKRNIRSCVSRCVVCKRLTAKALTTQLPLDRKAKATCQELKVGDIVLIELENKKRVMWPMGKIEKVYSSRDGASRVVQVRTSSGCLTRPI